MRNKRLIIAVCLLIVMIVSICGFAGCKPEEEVSPAQVLMSFYKGDTKPTVNSVELTNLKDYNIVNVFGDVLVARKSDDTGITYALFNIAENKVIATSDSNFTEVIDGVYKTYKQDDGQIVYAFYDKNTTLKDSVKQNEYYEQSGRLYFSDGYVIASTSNGVKVFEQAIDDINFAYFDNVADFEIIKSGALSIAISDDGDNFFVFDSNDKYIYSSRFSNLLKSTEKNFDFVDLGNGKASIQVFKELTDVEARRIDSYDYIDESGNYIALTTYIYDFANKTLTEIQFNKAITGAISTAKDGKYTLLSVCDINAGMRLSNESLIVTDSDLNVVVELNDLVDDAYGFAVIDESTYVIADLVSVHVFNAQGEEIKSFSNLAQYTGTGLLKVGNKFYNHKGEKVFELETGMRWDDDRYTNGLIYFSKEVDGYEKVGVYDSNTGKTTYYDGDDVSMYSSNVFTVSDSEGNVTVYGIYDGKAISDKKFASANYTNYGKYTIIMATDADGNVSYFAHWLERQSV